MPLSAGNNIGAKYSLANGFAILIQWQFIINSIITTQVGKRNDWVPITHSHLCWQLKKLLSDASNTLAFLSYCKIDKNNGFDL